MRVGIAIGIAIALIVAWLRAAWRRRGRSRLAKRRAVRALAGEADAEALLAEAGYAVIARQERRAWEVRLDGAPIAIELRCDLLVRARADDDKLYVAEVKTGAAAPRLDTAATRRQLLEYQVAYGADGVLLVDAEAGAVRRVDFDLDRAAPPPERERRPAITSIAIAAALGALIGHFVWP